MSWERDIKSWERDKYFFTCPLYAAVTIDYVFLVDEGIQIPLKAGHHRPASEKPLAFCISLA